MILLEIWCCPGNMCQDAPQCPHLSLSLGEGISQTQEGTWIIESSDQGRCAMTRERMFNDLLNEKKKTKPLFL